MIHLAALFIYPVKSCRGISLDEAEFSPDGLTHDREFLVVDGDNRFQTQRASPHLATIETTLTPKRWFSARRAWKSCGCRGL